MQVFPHFVTLATSDNSFLFCKAKQWIDFSDLRIHNKYPNREAFPRSSLKYQTFFLMSIFTVQPTMNCKDTKTAIALHHAEHSVLSYFYHFTTLSIQFHYYLVISYSLVHPHTSVHKQSW